MFYGVNHVPVYLQGTPVKDRSRELSRRLVSVDRIMPGVRHFSLTIL